MLTEGVYEIDNEEWKKGFADTFCQLRKHSDVTLEELALAIHVDTKTLRNYEAGRTIPTAVNLLKLAKFFNVSMDYLASHGELTTDFSYQTILAVGTMMKNKDVDIDREHSTKETLCLRIEDRTLSMIFRELYYTSEKDYIPAIQRLIQNFSSIRSFEDKLVDVTTFQNLIRDEFIFHDLEDDMDLYQDEKGDDCYDMDWITFDEVERRINLWEEMTMFEREEWWKAYSAQKNAAAEE